MLWAGAGLQSGYEGSRTATGFSLVVRAPSPSWPLLPLPQQ